jgi:hypothetical protein
LWDSFADTASPDPEDSLDWVTLLYIGTVILHMPEPVFWRCTLRKLQALFSLHCRMQNNPVSHQTA